MKNKKAVSNEIKNAALIVIVIVVVAVIIFNFFLKEDAPAKNFFSDIAKSVGTSEEAEERFAELLEKSVNLPTSCQAKLSIEQEIRNLKEENSLLINKYTKIKREAEANCEAYKISEEFSKLQYEGTTNIQDFQDELRKFLEKFQKLTEKYPNTKGAEVATGNINLIKKIVDCEKMSEEDINSYCNPEKSHKFCVSWSDEGKLKCGFANCEKANNKNPSYCVSLAIVKDIINKEEVPRCAYEFKTTTTKTTSCYSCKSIIENSKNDCEKYNIIHIENYDYPLVDSCNSNLCKIKDDKGKLLECESLIIQTPINDKPQYTSCCYKGKVC
ncbi:MAG: hypothetical protein QXG86_00340 [Candidatus Woesearchaeota archaeon]